MNAFFSGVADFTLLSIWVVFFFVSSTGYVKLWGRKVKWGSVRGTNFKCLQSEKSGWLDPVVPALNEWIFHLTSKKKNSRFPRESNIAFLAGYHLETAHFSFFLAWITRWVHLLDSILEHTWQRHWSVCQ